MRENGGMKRCSTCHEHKPVTVFYKDKSKVDGLTVNCRECRGRPAQWVSKWQAPVELRPTSRRCPTCCRTLPLTPENFYRSKSNPGGYSGTCKRCAAQWTREHRPRVLRRPPAPKQESRRASQARLLANGQKWCSRCGEIKDVLDFGSHRSKADGLTVKCKDCTNTAHAERRLARPEERAAIEARYAIKHPDAVRVKNHRRRARLREAPATDLTLAEWLDVVREYDGCCAYCGVATSKVTQDHVVPLARGGAHNKENVVPACASCNNSKGDQLLAEWYGFVDRSPRRRLLVLGAKGSANRLD